MKKVFLFLLLAGSQNLFAQQPLDLHQKILVYEALFIQSDGDTLTKEVIEMEFTENTWAGNQKDLKITYHTDTTGIKDFVYPLEKDRKKHEKNQLKRDQGKKGWDNWTWLHKSETTGYTLTDSSFFMHPPRGNQYKYTEISGMPTIKLNQLAAGESWKDRLIIMMGWQDFKGTLESTYQVEGKVVYENRNVNVPEAWDIKVNHTHSALGQSHSRIIFDNKNYGFLQLDNSYYDGNRIVMTLIEVKTK